MLRCIRCALTRVSPRLSHAQLSSYTGIVEEALGPTFGRLAEARMLTLQLPA